MIANVGFVVYSGSDVSTWALVKMGYVDNNVCLLYKTDFSRAATVGNYRLVSAGLIKEKIADAKIA